MTPQSAAPADELSRDELLQIMRKVNTAEAALAANAGGVTYGDLASVLEKDPSLRSRIDGVANTTAVLPGYTLTLILSDDKTSYQVSLTPKRACGVAMFSNEVGKIYQGRVIDCPAD